MKRDVLNSPRLKKLKRRHRRVILNKFLIFIFGFFVIFFSSVFLSRINKINISEIQITGNKVIDEGVLKAKINEAIAGNYLWLFPKTNIFYYPKDAITETLQNAFSRIKNVELSIKENKILAVNFEERTPVYTWCGVIFPSVDGQKCYFLDESGYAFDEAPYFSGSVYFKFYGLMGLNMDGTPSGSNFAQANFKQLIFFKNTIESIGLKPEVFYLKENGDIVIYLSPEKKNLIGPQIILNKDADLNRVAENLQAALNTEPLKSKFKNKYATLEYIDLRYGNKVYDKFR